MNTTIKLSVSSVLLAGFMTGCSQQQFQGGQQVAGGSQVSGGQQLTGGSQVSGGQQLASGSQLMGEQQIISGSQQSAGGQQVAGAQNQSVVMTDTHSHDLAAPTNIHSHSLQTEKRIYVPLPAKLQEKPPAVVMFDKPKVISKTHTAPKKIHKPKPIVKHKGIGLPPAQPGQCFAKVKQPAKFKNIVKRIQVSPAVNKRVKVRGPQYTWVNKKVLARPATHRYQYVPAQYRTVTKKILVKPERLKWQKGKTGPITRIDNMTGEILCLVKIPAVYRTVTQKVVARAAQRIKRHVPAVYKTVKEKKLSSPTQYRTIKTPARFVNKSYRVKVSDERYQWKPIVCKTPQATSQKTHQQTTAFDREQAIMKQLWIKQEAQRQAAARQKGASNKHQTNHARQALLAQKQRQEKRQALVAQQQRQAKQLALVAQKKRQQKQILEQRNRTKAKSNSYTAQSYAKPKVQNVAVKQAAQKTTKPTFVDNPASPLTRENAVFRIQKALKQRGYNPGTLDGRLGPTTVKALTAFQESKGLKTGTLNKDTLRALSLVN